jgi:tRNA 2-thiouridine synthesizing protein C
MSAATPIDFLFLSTRSPWTSAAAACADAALTAAVFGRKVTLAFCGDGVWQLCAGQDGKALGLKTLARAFPAFELYEIERVVVVDSALHERGLSAFDLLMPVDLVTARDLRALLARSKTVLTF